MGVLIDHPLLEVALNLEHFNSDFHSFAECKTIFIKPENDHDK